jgi:hypothetical protein
MIGMVLKVLGVFIISLLSIEVMPLLKDIDYIEMPVQRVVPHCARRVALLAD